MLTSATQPIDIKFAMGGLIVDSPCTLHPDSHQQYIVANNISMDSVIRSGGSEFYPFSIKLINCLPKDEWSTFQITFDGNSDGDYFAIDGSSEGLAIEIQDERGYISIPGVPMVKHPIKRGDNTLYYKFRLVGNSELLRVGNHFALIRYKLDYY